MDKVNLETSDIYGKNRFIILVEQPTLILNKINIEATYAHNFSSVSMDIWKSYYCYCKKLIRS